MRRLIGKYGFVRKIEGRSLVVCRGDEAATAKGLSIVGLFQRRYPRTPAVLLSDRDSPVAAFGVAPTLALHAPLPLENRRATRRLLKRTHARMLLLCGDLAGQPGRLIDRAYRRGVTIVALVDATAQSQTATAQELAALTGAPWYRQASLVLIFADDLQTPEPSEQGAVPQVRVAAESLDPDRSAGLIALLEPLITPSRREVSRQRGYHPKHRERLDKAENPLFRGFLAFKFRSYATLQELGMALGHPKTLLCLGNGPSSEDPRLLEYHPDAIFRVNLSWKARGFLAEKVDLVFTVLPEAVEALKPKIGFVFKTLEDEATMRSRYLYRWRRLAFATAERLGVYDRASFGAFSPTNGAIMLAVAVALRPERLIVAGVDLFSHPEGAYPGDSVTANDYTMGHDKALESAFILSLLRSYDGELEIVGPALRDLVVQPSAVTQGK